VLGPGGSRAQLSWVLLQLGPSLLGPASHPNLPLLGLAEELGPINLGMTLLLWLADSNTQQWRILLLAIPSSSVSCWQLDPPLLGPSEVGPHFSWSYFSWAHRCWGLLDTHTHHHWVRRQSQA